MTVLARWTYRVRQFNKLWSGGLSAAERAECARVLQPPVLGLFQAMRPEAQRHAFDVFLTLRHGGWDDADLLAAALVHDVGKGRVHHLQRVAWVLLGAVSVPFRRTLALHSPFGIWLGLRDNLLHAQKGAALVAAAGGSAMLVHLVRDHYEHCPGDALLCALQRADDDN